MKKSSCIKVHTLPVSKKAYNSFVARIDDILRDDRESAANMRTALDRYLAGDDSAASSLPATLRLAFGFLRHDIDTAISRSARARMRAQQRKAASSPASSATTAIPNTPAKKNPATPATINESVKNISAQNTLSEIKSADEESCSETSDQPSQPLTRQQRRALERASRRREQRPGPTGGYIEPESGKI